MDLGDTIQPMTGGRREGEEERGRQALRVQVKALTNGGVDGEPGDDCPLEAESPRSAIKERSQERTKMAD